MEKFFNTAGPNKADLHYTIDPLSRIDLEEMLMLIGQQKYFVLHAPRQTGKTSCLLALRDHLNQSGEYVAIICLTMAAVPSGEPSSMTRMWKHLSRPNTARIIFSMFSFSL